MTGDGARALVGSNYRPLRHLGPREDRPHTWVWPWRYLSAESARRLEAETGGYYFAYCGAVGVVHPPHPGQRTAPWRDWEMCTECLERSQLAL